MNQNLAALLLLATSHHKAARLSEAAALYREILIADPYHVDALHQFGVLAYQNGQYDTAIDLIGQALVQHNGRAAFHNSLGSAYLASGRTLEAIDVFRRALNLAPDSFEIRNNFANALQAGGAFTEAVANYRIAIEAAPGNPDVYNNLGRTFHLMGEIDNAINHFRLALKIKPDDSEILSNLGSSLCAKGDFAGAVDICRRAILIDPDSAFAHNNLGNALRRLGCLPEAAEAYRRAVAIAPAMPELHKGLGITLSLLGDQTAADESFLAILALTPSDAVIEDLGHTYYALGKLEEAVSVFQRVLERQPGNQNCLLALGEALNGLGRHAEGLDAISRGPGIARLSLASGIEENTIDAPVRIQDASSATPNFIGRWFMGEPALCERLIDFFEKRAAQHAPGRTGLGVNTAVKRSTDLVIFPNDLDTSGHEPVKDYLRQLEACCRDYAAQWPHFGKMLKTVDLVPFNIQRYDIGGHFQQPHCERFAVSTTHRVLAWMTYLNNVERGGETLFHNYGLSIQPERGKTLIWPAEWTHVHAGKMVIDTRKYIITGWMHFPSPTPSYRGNYNG